MPRNPEFDQRLGLRLRAIRRAASLSQSAVAERIGCSFQQIQKYELGKDRIAVSTLVMIAKAIGRPVADFLDEEAAPIAEAA